MSTANQSQRVATTTHNEIINTIITFLVDCGLNDDDVDSAHLFFAFEYAYKPLPRFWRDFNLSALIDAISEHFPNWRSAVRSRKQTPEVTLDEVKEILYHRAFDEANAEMMLALPLQDRPKNGEEASNWIFAELRKRKLETELVVRSINTVTK